MSVTATLQTTPITSGYLTYGGPNGKTLAKGYWKLVLTDAQGGTAGDIPASLFGLTYITGVSNIVDSTNGYVYPAAPVVDLTSILVGGGTASAAADLASGTYYVTVEGF